MQSIDHAFVPLSIHASDTSTSQSSRKQDDIRDEMAEALQEVRMAVPVLSNDLLRRIGRCLYDSPDELLSLATTNKKIASDLDPERRFAILLRDMNRASQSEFCPRISNALINRSLRTVGSSEMSDKALLHFFVTMDVPAIKARRRWIEKIVSADGISPLGKVQALAVLAQKSNVQYAEKDAFERILGVIAALPVALRSAETIAETLRCHAEQRYHTGGLTGLVALVVNQSTDVKQRQALDKVIDEVAGLPLQHRASPLYQAAFFLCHFKDKQNAFDRIVEGIQRCVPMNDWRVPLEALRGECGLLPEHHRAFGLAKINGLLLQASLQSLTPHVG